jgi:hypothetical protein
MATGKNYEQLAQTYNKSLDQWKVQLPSLVGPTSQIQ